MAARNTIENPAFDSQRRETELIRQMTESESDGIDPKLRLLLALAVASIIVGGTIDLWLDRPENWLSFHVIFETLMIAGALLMAVTLWLGWWHAAHSVVQLRRHLEARSAERDAWRESARLSLDGLAAAIARQFGVWQLTPAESEIAMLVLKGFSHKHIASLTHRSERTVRQHAASAYQKAGVRGRVELAAFFLGGLMLPESAAHE